MVLQKEILSAGNYLYRAKLPQEWVDMKLITYEVEDSVCKELQLKLKKTN